MKFSNIEQLKMAEIEVGAKAAQEKQYIVLKIREISDDLKPANIARKLFKKFSTSPGFKKFILPAAIVAGTGIILTQRKTFKKAGAMIENAMNDVVEEVIAQNEYKVRAIAFAIIKNILPASIKVESVEYVEINEL